MKEDLQKQEVKLEWENNHRAAEGTSPHHISTAMDDQQQQQQQQQQQRQPPAESPRSVITSRRHVRTITAAGHITETLAEHEPSSPENGEQIPQQQQQQQQQHHHIVQQRNIKQESQDAPPPPYTEDQHQQQQPQQYHIHIQHQHSPEGQQRVGENKHQHVIYATANGQEIQVAAADGAESTIAMTVEEPPR